MMENIHSETYALLIDTYIKNAVEKYKLFHAIDTVPSVKKKQSGRCDGLRKETLHNGLLPSLQWKEYSSVAAFVLYSG
jgi:ribonucleotide reductase beta subunit family protein with ferritin-like domain